MENKNYIGLKNIATAAGVSYHSLWVAIRSRAIILPTITVIHSDIEEYCAGPRELIKICAVLKNVKIKNGDTHLEKKYSEQDILPESLGTAVNALEKKLEDMKHGRL